MLSVVANKIHVYGDFKPLPTPVPTFHSKSTGARTARPSKVPTAEPTLLPTGERSGDDKAASDSLEDTRCFSARSQFRQKSRQNSDMDECRGQLEAKCRASTSRVASSSKILILILIPPVADCYLLSAIDLR